MIFLKISIILFLLANHVRSTLAFGLVRVQSACTQAGIWSPDPSLVQGLCLQCFCFRSPQSICKVAPSNLLTGSLCVSTLTTTTTTSTTTRPPPTSPGPGGIAVPTSPPPGGIAVPTSPPAITVPTTAVPATTIRPVATFPPGVIYPYPIGNYPVGNYPIGNFPAAQGYPISLLNLLAAFGGGGGGGVGGIGNGAGFTTLPQGINAGTGTLNTAVSGPAVPIFFPNRIGN